MVKVAMRFADNAYDERMCDDSVFETLRSMKAQGESERAIIEALFGDDWAAPPSIFTLSGRDHGGVYLTVTLDYRD